jgi:hypothetical protein
MQEVVGDKGYHSNQSLIELEAIGVRSYISEPIVADAAGRRTLRPVPRCIAIGGAFVARVACGCCGSVVNISSGPSRISTRRAACAACTSAATRTFWSAC